MKKLLMELRPCFDAFSGVPQDTRITYGLMAGRPDITLGGHLLDWGGGAVGFNWSRQTDSVRTLFQMSRHVVALAVPEHGAALTQYAKKSLAYLANRLLGAHRGLHPFDAAFFGDYLWRTLFEKSLASERRAAVLGTQFMAGSLSWPFMCDVLAAGLPPLVLDTSGWDVYLAQTPFPAKVSRDTQLVIRFHDAVPIQMPDTINQPRRHQKFFARSLDLARRDGWFVCNSEATAKQLLRICPELEQRTAVVHCCVPDVYRREEVESVRDIVSKRISMQAVDVSRFIDVHRYKRFVGRWFNDEYLLAVGSLEPRKNYGTLLAGWEQYRRESGRDIKLIIVGGDAWNAAAVTERIRNYSHDGNVFLLQNVPGYELRRLYSRARATVIASFLEGFSLTGIEAMRCQTPVVASDIETHREIYGDHARYFDPNSAGALCQALQDLAGNSEAGLAGITRAAREHSQRYSEQRQAGQWSEFLARLG